MDRGHTVSRWLFATDLPASLAQVGFAARLAARLGVRMALFHAVKPVSLLGDMAAGVMYPVVDVLASARRALEDIADASGAVPPPHVAVAAAVDPARAILDAAGRLGSELVVLPTHGRGGLARALLGSTAEQVLRRTRLPAMLLTEAMVAAAHGETPAGPILAATDLSPGCEQAVRYAADLAARLRLPLLLYSVMPLREPPPYGGGAPVAVVPTPRQQRTQERTLALVEIAAALHSQLPVHTDCDIDDDPAAAIVRAAKAHTASFVVVATHGRRGLARTLLGSVAEQVVRTSTVPVLCTHVEQ